ncbi:MAG: HU family DNA-binding protein [Candidatus Methylomirabilales bacterium]
MSTVKDVVKRIEHEVGLSRAASIRIARKLNELAKSVKWATPVGDGGTVRKRTRRTAGIGKVVLVNRKSHMGRSPQTGEPINIPVKRAVRFRVGKVLKGGILKSRSRLSRKVHRKAARKSR